MRKIICDGCHKEIDDRWFVIKIFNSLTSRETKVDYCDDCYYSRKQTFKEIVDAQAKKA